MDDARLANEMTLDGIARQLNAIRDDIAGVKTDVSSVRADLTSVKADLTSVKTDLAGVKTDVAGVKADGTSVRGELASLRSEMRDGFNASKVRDEELRSLAKLGLEANQGLLETTTARFDATDKRHGEEIGLLKDVLRSSA